MAEYYFLASLLPQLEIGHIPPINFSELKELIRINLTKEDKLKVAKLLSLIDMENLLALWSHQPIDKRGNYTKEELEQALSDLAWPRDREFRDYLKEFIRKYPTNEEKVANFPFLMSTFLEKSAEENEGFLAEYFQFEREFRLVLVGFRAKKMGRDLFAELQYEDPTEPIVAEILAQKDAVSYEPPFEWRDLKPIFLSFSDFPLELHKALLAYSFDRIEELCGNAHFSIDRILAFMARLLIVERWLELDVQAGLTAVRKIEENIR